MATTWDSAITWDAVGVFWDDGAIAPPTPGGAYRDWHWPGSKDDPIHEQIEREINQSLKKAKPQAREKPALEAPRSDAEYWRTVSLKLAQFKTHANAVAPILPTLLAAQTRIDQKNAIALLNRALRALQVIIMIEEDER